MMTAEQMKSALRMDDLRGDPWGTAMGAFFDVAEELDRQGEAVPDGWRYRPGVCGPPDYPESYFGQEISGSHPGELTKFGNLLYRYTAMLDHAGRSY